MNEFHLTHSPLDRTVNCLEASAGTGKTYALAWIYLRLLLEKEVPASDILVVTFTKAATAELRDRIRRRLVEALEVLRTGKGDDENLAVYFQGQSVEDKARAANLLQNALEVFDLTAIYTIDSFCQRTLRDAALETGVLFDLELIPNQDEFIHEVAADYCRRCWFHSEPVLGAAAFKSGLTPDSLAQLLSEYVKHPDLKLVTTATSQSANKIDEQIVGAFNELVTQWQAVGGADRLADFFATGEESSWSKNQYKLRADVLAQAHHLHDGLVEKQWSGRLWNAIGYFNINEVAKKVKKHQSMPSDLPEVLAVLKTCGHLGQLLEDHGAVHRRDFLLAARKSLEEIKHRNKQASFTDQIARLKSALHGPSGPALVRMLQNRYQAALIDESQDTDSQQWEVFRSVFAGKDNPRWLFLIGDPKQAIYRFRGADVHTYLKAAEATDDDHRFTLGTNWRSESRLVHAVNAVFSSPVAGVPFPVFLEQEIEFQPVTPGPKADGAPLQFSQAVNKRPAPLQVWTWEPARDFVSADEAKNRLPGVVANEIARLLSGGIELGTESHKRMLQPGDIAVLVESHAQATRIQEALHECEIPCVEKATASVFETGEARELQWILQAVLSPGRETSIKAALTTDAMGLDGNALAGLVADESSWQQRLQGFARYRKIWDEDGFYAMFQDLLRRERIAENLLRFSNAERRLTNFLHIAEMMEKARRSEHLGPTRLLQWLESRRNGEGDTPEDHQLRLESDDDAVQIVTMHSSKGLEYPVVFCPFITKSAVKRKDKVIFHDESGDLYWDIDLEPAPENKIKANKETLADLVRLLYVALTRARNRCYLVSARHSYFKRNSPNSLAWVMQRKTEIPDDPAGELQGLKSEWHAPWGQIKAEADCRAGSGEAISIAELPNIAEPLKWHPGERTPAAITPRKFGKSEIRPAWFLTSFSGISSPLSKAQREARNDLTDGQIEHEVSPDRDDASADAAQTQAATTPQTPLEGIFALPAGARTGDCLHKILEQYDFQNPEETTTRQLVQQQLDMAGLPAETHRAAVLELLSRIRHLPLKSGETRFRLSDIPARDRLAELEFHFPAAAFQGWQLLEAIRRPDSKGSVAHLAGDRKLGAYMKGFIDLILVYQGRYHIIDWKSNLLGLSPADYGPAALKEKILEEFYDLQYHIYIVALDKFLRQRLPDYDYEKHFGGVHYIFLRGLDPGQPEAGVFHARPDKQTIEHLSQVFQPAPEV